MAKSARPGASRADVIGSPSTWATRGVCPSLLSLLRPPPRPHPSLFPLARAQARPSHLLPLIQAGSPGHELLKVRRQSRPPARRRAGAPSGVRHRMPDSARLPTGRQFTFSTFAQTSSASLSPEGRDLSQRVGTNILALTVKNAKSAIRDLCRELSQNAIMHNYNKNRPTELPLG